MKQFRQFIKESISISESMRSTDVVRLEELLKALKKIGGVEKFEDKVFKGDDMDKNLIELIERYDSYMEDIMWMAISCDDGIERTAKKIQNMAEENEHHNGTEAHFAVEFLEELCRYLNIDID